MMQYSMNYHQISNMPLKNNVDIVPVITKREILFFGSVFFSRTVLDFFLDSEEHDFHFSC